MDKQPIAERSVFQPETPTINPTEPTMKQEQKTIPTPTTEISTSFPNMTPEERNLMGEYWTLGKQLSISPLSKDQMDRYNAIKDQALDIVKRNPGRTPQTKPATTSK